MHLKELVEERTKELQDALNVKSRFVATVSHGNLFSHSRILIVEHFFLFYKEIRTPLSGIMGSLTLLASTSLNEEQEDLIRIAHLCGEQLSVIINDILGQ
jgi:signal transduction histidine kinase